LVSKVDRWIGDRVWLHDWLDSITNLLPDKLHQHRREHAERGREAVSPRHFHF
jgi:hypothetical protein